MYDGKPHNSLLQTRFGDEPCRAAQESHDFNRGRCQSGVQTTTRDFDTMDVDSLYIETVSEDGADDIVYHKRVSDNKTTYYFGQGSEVSTEYDEHGNMTKQQGKDATMGNFEQTFENTYDDNGNLVSMKSTYNGDDGYFIDYIYAALNDASYNGEGTLLFDAATDTPSAD